MKKKNLHRIMIDLDGVLNEYGGKYIPDKISNVKQGSEKFLETLFLEGKYELVLFTSREPEQVNLWLEENGLKKYFSFVTNKKLPAKIYIDDRALKFEGSFEQTLEDIKKFKCYWQN